LGNLDLDQDFDPDHHDKDMEDFLGDDYDEHDENLDPDSLLQAPNEELDISASKERGAKPKASKQKGTEAEEEEWEEYEEQEQEQGEDGEKEPDWWLCDNCHKGIPGGKKRFDCTVCDDFTLCAKCFRVRSHPHRFVPRRIPEHCMPPEDLKEVEPRTLEQTDAFDEYFQLDYEDIIAGDLPTRFKYRQVAPKSFGLSDADLLQKDDKDLNQIVPIKRLAPYRHDADAHDPASKRQRDNNHNGVGRKAHAQWRNTKKAKDSAVLGMSSARLEAYGIEPSSAKKRKKKTKSKGKSNEGS